MFWCFSFPTLIKCLIFREGYWPHRQTASDCSWREGGATHKLFSLVMLWLFFLLRQGKGWSAGQGYVGLGVRGSPARSLQWSCVWWPGNPATAPHCNPQAPPRTWSRHAVQRASSGPSTMMSARRSLRMARRATSAGKRPGVGRTALAFPGPPVCEGDQKGTQ